MTNKTLSNGHSCGFSLVEILLSVSLLSIAALAIGTLFKQMSDQKAHNEHKTAVVALASEIIENLKLPEACDRVLGGSSSSLQTVDEAWLQLDGSIAGEGWSVELDLSGIQSGVSMSGTLLSASAPNNILPLKHLQIDSLKMADGKRLPDVGANHRYIVNIYLKASEIAGLQFKEVPIGSTTLTIDAVTRKVVACGAVKSAVFSSACTEMGCEWDGAQTPSCRCKRSQVVCAAPGAVPVSFTSDGYPNCVSAGGDSDCPSGEYLTGFGIGYQECIKLPTTTTPPLVNGLCGPAGGGTFASAAAIPTTDKCSSGAASTVSGSGPFTWSCMGSGGGSNASCSANLSASPHTWQTVSVGYCDSLGNWGARLNPTYTGPGPASGLPGVGSACGTVGAYYISDSVISDPGCAGLDWLELLKCL